MRRLASSQGSHHIVQQGLTAAQHILGRQERTQNTHHVSIDLHLHLRLYLI
jgi:hypothetical protein